MSLRINDTAPDFTAQTTQGLIHFHEWLGESWGILFSHPKDFTPVCTTELGYIAGMSKDFAQRDCKVMGLSVDSVEDHQLWQQDIEAIQRHKVTYPIIADDDLQIAKCYNMLPADEPGGSQGRLAINNATVRSVFIIAPDKTIKMMLTYPMTTGRNFDEILRVLDAIQLTTEYQVVTPVNWKAGEDVIILPTVSDNEARELFPAGFKTLTSYIRTTPQPTHH
ncbi:peroxiredoxin [Methylophaga sp.]|uniref:peroxiredoxin n=1 Tax=Methylophaga sp. TaxID=2024840 RepID=UPI003F6A4499